MRILTPAIFVLLILAISCDSPTEPRCEHETVIQSGILSDLTRTTRKIDEKYYGGWLVSTGIDLTENEFSFNVRAKDYTWYEPQKKILANMSTLFIFKHVNMDENTPYKLRIR